MAKTISELKAQSAEVKNASAIGENTATRVGQLFGDIVEHVEQYENTKNGKDSSQDAQMQSLVSAEESRAKGEERGLQNQIHAEKIDRQTADTYLGNLIQQESSARETADENISTALANETARAQAAEQELAAAQIYTSKIKDGAVTTPKIADGAVTYEKTDIIAQELGTNMTKVPSQKVVTDAIQKEETERKADINGLTAALASETIQREQGDENLNAAIEAEKDRAKAREQELNTAIQQETERAEAREQELTVAIQQETERAEAREQELTVAIQQETDRATAAEEAIIFDVSAHNNGAVFESISALLGDDNLSTLIPTSVRRGGMTIRFIQGSEQGSDNIYVQYRLMADEFSTVITDWQGVDAEPTAGSYNLIESGGVDKSIINVLKKFSYEAECVQQPDIIHYYLPYSFVKDEKYTIIIECSHNGDNFGSMLTSTEESTSSAVDKILQSVVFLNNGQYVVYTFEASGNASYLHYYSRSYNGSIYIFRNTDVNAVITEINTLNVRTSTVESSVTTLIPQVSDIKAFLENAFSKDKGIFHASDVRVNKIILNSTYNIIDRPESSTDEFMITDYIKLPDNWKEIRYKNISASNKVNYCIAKTTQDDSQRIGGELTISGYVASGVIVNPGNISDYKYFAITVYRGVSTSPDLSNVEVNLVVDETSVVKRLDIQEERINELGNVVGIVDTNIYNPSDLRAGYFILNTTGNHIILPEPSDSANHFVITDYIELPEQWSAIEYGGIVAVNVIGARLSKTKDDKEKGILIALNISGTTAEGRFLYSNDYADYKYLCVTVYRGTSETADLSNVYLRYINDNLLLPRVTALESKVEDIKDIIVIPSVQNFSERMFAYGKKAPRKPCISFSMDILKDWSFGDNYSIDDYINILKQNGIDRTTFFIRPTLSQVEPTPYAVLATKGHEVSLHSISEDCLGEGDVPVAGSDYPTTQEAEEIIQGYQQWFKQYGFPYSIGWVTSRGVLHNTFSPIVEKYVAYGHTLANTPASASTDDLHACVNMPTGDKMKILRVGMELNTEQGIEDENAYIAKINELIDYTIAQGGFLSLYSHGLQNLDVPYTLRLNVLNGVLTHLKPYIDNFEVFVGTEADIVKYFYND